MKKILRNAQAQTRKENNNPISRTRYLDWAGV